MTFEQDKWLVSMTFEGPRVLVIAGLADRSLDARLTPILRHENVLVDVVRTSPGPKRDRVTYICPPTSFRRSPVLCFLWKVITSIRLGLQSKILCVYAILVFPHLYLALIISALARRPLIYMVVASYHEFRGKGHILNRLTMLILRRVSKVLVSDRTTVKHLLNCGISRSRIVMYQRLQLADLSHFVPIGLERTTDLIVVSRLVQDKNIGIFVDIVARLKERRPSIRADIVGDGPLRKVLEEQVSKKQLSDNICFRGYISSPAALNRVLNTARIFVLNSSHEGGPLTVIEAMAAGLCCVTSPVGETPDLIKNGINGFLIERFNDVDAYVKIIAWLLDDSSRLQKIQHRAAKISENSRSEEHNQFWLQYISYLRKSYNT
jgi:glycosyltransferase involved in cell wall biosynthesis